MEKTYYYIVYRYNRKGRRWEIFFRSVINGHYDDMMLTEFYGNKAEAINTAKNWAKYCEEVYSVNISSIMHGRAL